MLAMRIPMSCLLALVLFPPLARTHNLDGVPVFEISQDRSTIKFSVKGLSRSLVNLTSGMPRQLFNPRRAVRVFWKLRFRQIAWTLEAA
jgi:hypothetical protein